MSPVAKRKSGGDNGGGERAAKKSKGGHGGQWRTPAQDAKMARLGDRGAILEVGDQGIWVTYARGMDRKATAEFRRLCDDLGQEMYGILPPEEGTSADGGEESDGGDIESLIQKEIAGIKDDKSEQPLSRRAFNFVRVTMDCVLFVKTRSPVQPVEFARRICEDAKACTNMMERKTRYINRLTPVTAVDKATENGVERAARQALAPWFTLTPTAPSAEEASQGEEDTEPAYTYAIRQSIRNNSDLKQADLINQIAGLVDKRHKVNLGQPDKVILVDVFQNFCGVGVIEGRDWEGLRKMNVNEMYKLSSSS